LKALHTTAIGTLAAMQRELEYISVERVEGVTVWDDPTKIPSGAYLPTLVEWVWNNDKGGFTAFDTHTALIIEIAYNKDKSGKCHLTHGFYGDSPGGYLIDFQKMLQFKVQTGFYRTVQRRMNWVKETEHRKKCFDLEMKIKSLDEENKKLNQQIKDLTQQLQQHPPSKKKNRI